MDPVKQRKPSLLPELATLRKEFELALIEGEDVLNSYEQELVSSLLKQIDTKGNEFNLSVNQAEGWKKARGKLKKEGLLS